jgi:hypothetical protein
MCLPEQLLEARLGAHRIQARIYPHVADPGRLLVVCPIQPSQPAVDIPERDMYDGDVVGGDMPVGRRPRKPREGCACLPTPELTCVPLVAIGGRPRGRSVTTDTQ